MKRGNRKKMQKLQANLRCGGGAEVDGAMWPGVHIRRSGEHAPGNDGWRARLRKDEKRPESEASELRGKLNVIDGSSSCM